MSRVCTKCKSEIPDNAELEPLQSSYPCCPKCWDEWKEYRTMVMLSLIHI